jgi:uncharacterized protein
VDKESTFARATSGLLQIPEDWMPATATRALVFEDPVLIWLEYHGESNGFHKDSPSPYDFMTFIFEKGRQFENKWISEFAPDAVRVCSHAYEVRQVEKFQQTLELIERGTPVIASPALWWAPEKILGVPDLLVRSDWLSEHLPNIRLQSELATHYVILDMKFTTKLDSTEKKVPYSNYAAQVRIYSYMVGELTGVMASHSFLVCRDRIDNPIEVSLHSSIGRLDEDLRRLRDRFVDIKLNGRAYRPGIDSKIAINLSNDQDDPWHTAKIEIARDRVPGGDLCLVYEIGAAQRQALADQGFGNLKALMETAPERIPLESCKGLGTAKCPRIRAVLRANQTGTVVRNKPKRIPAEKPFEFYVDFETFNNLNVNFDKDWPALRGCEMIFMVGIAWVENDKLQYQAIVADSESVAGERRLLENFEKLICRRTNNPTIDFPSAVLFHWTSAELWQLKRACDRQGFPISHPLRNLPWFDLQKEVFLAEPIGIPGAWGYGIKEVVPSLGLLQWPGDLDDGLRASVAGWKGYQSSRPLESPDMQIVVQYNEVDCKALHEIVKWLRRSA